MFLGTYEQRLDEKNRLTIPARLRDGFADGVFLARELDACLAAYTRAGFDRVVAEQLSRFDPLSREGRTLKRYIYSSCVELELDRAGRVAVPPLLIQHAGLERDVVVAGAGDRLEIWNPETWDRVSMEFGEGSIQHVADRVAREPR